MQWYDGAELMNRRKARGWTQADIAEQTGLSKNQIIAMEKGQFSGGIKYLQKYLNIFGLKIAFEEPALKVPQFDELSSLFSEDNK